MTPNTFAKVAALWGAGLLLILWVGMMTIQWPRFNAVLAHIASGLLAVSIVAAVVAFLWFLQ